MTIDIRFYINLPTYILASCILMKRHKHKPVLCAGSCIYSRPTTLQCDTLDQGRANLSAPGPHTRYESIRGSQYIKIGILIQNTSFSLFLSGVFYLFYIDGRILHFDYIYRVIIVRVTAA